MEGEFCVSHLSVVCVLLAQMMCSVSGEDKMSSIEERETCSYEVQIHTPLLCAIPLFSHVQQGKENVIKCSPLVSQEIYREYVKMKGASLACRDPLPNTELGQNRAFRRKGSGGRA